METEISVRPLERSKRHLRFLTIPSKTFEEEGHKRKKRGRKEKENKTLTSDRPTCRRTSWTFDPKIEIFVAEPSAEVKERLGKPICSTSKRSPSPFRIASLQKKRECKGGMKPKDKKKKRWETSQRHELLALSNEMALSNTPSTHLTTQKLHKRSETLKLKENVVQRKSRNNNKMVTRSQGETFAE